MNGPALVAPGYFDLAAVPVADVVVPALLDVAPVAVALVALVALTVGGYLLAYGRP